MGFFLTLFLWAAVTVASALLRPRVKMGPAPRPSGLGDFMLPTAEEGRPLPILWGTRKLSGPNITWYGDLEAQAIKREIPGFTWGGPRHTWNGFRYYLGEQLCLCSGPIDAVVDILFDDKSLGLGVITVEAGKNTLRFGGSPPPWHTATIPPGAYGDVSALALATEDAMKAAETGNWRVTYGYHLVPERGSDLWYSVLINGVATDYGVNLGGIYDSGPHVAGAIEFALNAREFSMVGGPRATFSVQYDDTSGKFRIFMHGLTTAVTGFYIRGIVDYAKTALPNLGFQMGVDKFGSGRNSYVESDYATLPRRFVFAYGGYGGQLDLSAAETTCGEVFGFGSGQKTIGQYVCEADRGGPSYTAIQLYTDLYRIAVNAPDLFGGEDSEGGIVGAIDVMIGSNTQQPNDYLLSVVASPLPAYRGVCYAVFRHLYIGTTAYPKNPAFVLRRCPNGLGLSGGHHNISGDANPACMIYEALTDARWGAGLPAARIDVDRLRAVAETLYAEGLGLSMLVDSGTTVGDIISDILRHIDGAMYADPATGKITLALARNDYPEELLVLDESNCTVEKFARPSWADTKNIIKVRYLDRARNFTERVAEAQDGANVAARGGETAVEEFDYPGLSTPLAAQKAAARCLSVESYPLARMEITANRLAWALRPASVFRLTWPRLGIANMVCRVARVSPGELRDGRIKIDAVEDVFGIAWTVFSGPPEGGWVDPARLPQPLLDQRLEEAPYAVVGSEDIKVLTLAARGRGAADGYEAWTDEDGGIDYAASAEVATFTPSGTLTEEVNPTATEILIDSGPDMDRLVSVDEDGFGDGLNVLLVGDEWIAWKTITDNEDGTYTLSTIARGCRDSVPAAHDAGTRVWFESRGSGYTKATAYGADLQLAAKLRPYVGEDLLPLVRAQRLLCATAARASRPYVPTAVVLNDDPYPAAIAGELTISWSHRDRLGAWSYADSGATSSPEADTHYRVKIYGDGGTLKHTEDDITGTSYLYPEATEKSENGGNWNSTLRVVLETINDEELVSRQAYDWTVTR